MSRTFVVNKLHRETDRQRGREGEKEMVKNIKIIISKDK